MVMKVVVILVSGEKRANMVVTMTVVMQNGDERVKRLIHHSLRTHSKQAVICERLEVAVVVVILVVVMILVVVEVGGLPAVRGGRSRVPTIIWRPRGALERPRRLGRCRVEGRSVPWR